MRILLIVAVATTALPNAAVAAPTSMLHSMPQAEKAEPAREGRMSWLTKWFRKEEPKVPQFVKPGGPLPPVVAYQPPSSPLTTQAAPSVGYAGFAPAQQALPPATALPPLGAPLAVPAVPMASVTTPLPAPSSWKSPAGCKSLREQGHAKDRAGALAEAEELYRQAIGADPTSAAAVNDLGLCLARQGKLEPSAAVFRQAIMMRPDKQLYRNNIATVLIELGETQEALAHLKTTYAPAAAHFNVGQLLARGGKTDEAVSQLQQALTLEPTFGPARDALAKLTPQPTLAPPAAQVVAAPPQPVTPPIAAYQPVAPQQAAPYMTAPQPTTPTFAPAQVAAVPTIAPPVTPAAPAPVAQPAAAPTGVPTFPRLLPPVMAR